MEEIPLLDQSTLTPADRLCFMILDHLRRYEDAFEDFRKEYTDAKRIKKYNQIMRTVWLFLDNEYSDEYTVHYEYDKKEVIVFQTYGEQTQLAISICIKKLSNERILSIWKYIFPNHNIIDLLDHWEEEGNMDFSHIVWGHDHDTADYDAHHKVMLTKMYTEADVKKLLGQLSLVELADIVPKIDEVTYRPVKV